MLRCTGLLLHNLNLDLHLPVQLSASLNGTRLQKPALPLACIETTAAAIGTYLQSRLGACICTCTQVMSDDMLLKLSV